MPAPCLARHLATRPGGPGPAAPRTADPTIGARPAPDPNHRSNVTHPTVSHHIASDPGELLGRVDGATDRLLATAAELDDEHVRRPSLLPGWSRGHVLTHLARNADGLRNLLVWARTRTETPMYVSQQARADAIDAGSGRPAAVLLEDVRESAARFAAEARLLRPQDWQVTVGGSRRTHPAWYTLWRRLSETEIHHVDLEAGYGPADWPPAFVADCLPVVVGDLTGRDDTPTVLLRDSDTGLDYRIGPASLIPDPEPPGAVTVTGPGCEILAWLTGRNQGASLAADPAAPLPAIPAW